MNTQQRYLAEMQERYQRLVKQEEDRDLLQERIEDHKKKERRHKRQERGRKLEHLEKEHLAMDKYVTADLRVFNIIIDSDHRDVNIYPNANDFVVKLQDYLTNVAAIRVLKSEFYQSANSLGYMVFNDVRVPLQLYNVEHAYLYLNGYNNTAVANDTNVALFGRIGPGTEIYPGVSADPYKDPYIYVMRPVDPRLRRFHLKLLDANGALYSVEDARIVITLAVYCIL